MKDLDFDELDRAVTSLMGSPNASPSEEKPLEITPVSPYASQPVQVPERQSASVTESVAVAVVRPEKPSIVAPRSGGRFMDMINAPSTTKSRTVAPLKVTPSSREGLTITPPPGSIESTPPIEQTPSSVSETTLTTSSDMPDPIEASTLEQEEQLANDIAESAKAPPVLPLESPFLSNAKVDKRPLNPGDATAEVIGPESTDAVIDNEGFDTTYSDTLERAHDDPIDTPKAPELDSELVAIESGNTIVESSRETPVSTPEITSPLPVDKAVPSGTTSIAQQYTEQPSSGDKSHAAIYDASQYPETLNHPAKKKSGWMWVLWVVLLLGVGAGGAVVLYVLGIIP